MRNRDQVIWDFVQQWLRKATSDLGTAKILLDANAMKEVEVPMNDAEPGIARRLARNAGRI